MDKISVVHRTPMTSPDHLEVVVPAGRIPTETRATVLETPDRAAVAETNSNRKAPRLWWYWAFWGWWPLSCGVSFEVVDVSFEFCGNFVIFWRLNSFWMVFINAILNRQMAVRNSYFLVLPRIDTFKFHHFCLCVMCTDFVFSFAHRYFFLICNDFRLFVVSRHEYGHNSWRKKINVPASKWQCSYCPVSR